MSFFLNNLFAVVCGLLLFTACNPSAEKIEKEYDKIGKQLDSVNTYLTKLQESKAKSQILQDSINFYRAPYDSLRENLSTKIHETDSLYLLEIQRVKEDHYSKYGDDFNAQPLLDKAIDQAKAKKDAVVASYKSKIKEAENRVKENSAYQKFKEELALLPKYSKSKEDKALERQKELSGKMMSLREKLSKK